MIRPAWIRPAAGLLLALGTSAASADLFWDVNGDRPGGGINNSAPGTWGVDNFWSTSPAGDVPTMGWIPGDNTIFSAGSDVKSAASITVDGVQRVGRLSIEEGTVFLNSGSLDFGGSPAIINTTGNLHINSTELVGVNGLTKLGPGTLRFGGNKTYGGATDVNAGTLVVMGTLSGGGPVTVYGTLAGNGKILSHVTAMSGSHIAPGNPPSNPFGVLTVNELGLNSAILDIQIDTFSIEAIQVSANDGLKLSGNSIVNIFPAKDGTLPLGYRFIIGYAGAPLPNLNGLALASSSLGIYHLSLENDPVSTSIFLHVEIAGTPHWNPPKNDGSWGVDGNWTTNYYPSSVTDDAYFPLQTAHTTVTLDGDRTVHRMYLDNSNGGYTIASGRGEH